MKIKSLLFGYFWRFVEKVPILIPTLLAVYSFWIVLLLVSNNFNDSLILLGLLILVPAFIILWRFNPLDRPGSLKQQRIFDLLAIIFIGFWCLFNVQFTAKHIFSDRDPGVYTLGAIHLIDNNSTNIAVEKPFGSKKGLLERSLGFWVDDAAKYNDDKAHIQPQGMHLLSGFAGIAGKVGGLKALFAVGVIFGGTALLALYAFSRQIVRPGWAFVSTLVFGATLPLIYFSRDLYTEPLSATFTMAGLALVWLAYKKRKNRNLPLWLLAGVVTGASILIRPDGYLTATGILIFLAISIILEKNKDREKELIQSSLVFVVAIIPLALLAYFDMKNYSITYYIDNKKTLLIQVLLFSAVIVTGCVGFVLSRKTKIVRWLDGKTKSWRTNLAIGSILFGALVIISRPLWDKPLAAAQNGTTYLVQLRTGQAIEPRTYAENTYEWVSWYVGGALLLLSIIGLVIMIKKVFEKREYEYLGIVFTFLIAAGIYFIDPKITPDHIWAARRFLPVIFPCVIVIGVFALTYLLERANIKDKFLRKSLYGFAALYLILQPLVITRPFIKVAEYDSAEAAFMSFCEKLPDNAAVLWLGDNVFAFNAVQTTRAFCDVPSAGFTVDTRKPVFSLDQEKLKQLASAAEEKGLNPYIALQGNLRSRVYINNEILDNLNPSIIYGFEKVEQTVTGPPRSVTPYTDSIEIGKLHLDGTITKVE